MDNVQNYIMYSEKDMAVLKNKQSIVYQCVSMDGSCGHCSS